ncbi:heme ABC transporter ATP-binding protein [Haloparvum sp. PAK95]|uniref:heme ABC transporter ATP-binding protein n=1 Tax=Haloparvum sp. PAK95 TaxID=3418962 RepID=UPI003D2F2174
MSEREGKRKEAFAGNVGTSTAEGAGSTADEGAGSTARGEGHERAPTGEAANPIAPDVGEVGLSASDLTVSFGDVPVLKGVDVDVDPGTFVGLVGPNGAGKTTLLRTLRGTLSPESGEVSVGGDAIAALSAREASRRVASVPQDTALSFDFTVEQVVEMGRTPHQSRFGGRDAEDTAAVDAAMERTAVAQFAERPITSVSGGERQRVLLARALAQATPVLLLDEPTGSLDVNHAVQTLELVSDLVAEGRTAVAAIHDLNLAARYCDELVLLADGEVRAAGPPTDVLTAETLRDAFGARTLVTDQPGTDAPLVTPLAEVDPSDRRVHVVGTGPRAATGIARLAAAGFTVSAGVLPAGDVAAARASDVDAETAVVPAFAVIDDEAAADAVALAREADCTVVVGEPAARNDEVATAVTSGRRVVVDAPEVSGREASLADLPAAVQAVLSEADDAE